MKNLMIKGITLCLSITLLLGCEAVKNTNKTQRGAVIGAAGGAVLGGILGNNVGSKDNAALGAVLGGVVGGAAGGLIGKRMDKQAQKIEEEIPGAEVKRVGEGINVIFDENSGVRFATNKSSLTPESMQTLDKLVGVFQEYPQTNVVVDGHTDSSGDDEYNMQLSKKRAQTVVDYLASHGIERNRFTVAWHGENTPIADNSTAEGRARNRRVELGIVANEEMKKEAQQQTGELKD